MIRARKATIFFAFHWGLALLFAAMFLHERQGGASGSRAIELMAGTARELGLTDLCLFTEASYTRHLTQTDLRTPFQDHPVSLEHFPSGSLVTPLAEPERNDG